MISINDEILNDIDTVVFESTIDVYDALLDQCEKSLTIYSESYIQEENVWNYATGKNSGESGIMKVIKFIPRLIIGIIKSIKSIFTSKSKKELDKSTKNASYVIEKASPQQLTYIANEVNKNGQDTIIFDPNNKRFNIGRKFKHVKNSIIILLLAPKIIRNIITQCRSGNTDYKRLATELWSIIKRDKNADEETTAITLDALKSLLDDSWRASMAVAALSEEAGLLLENKMAKDFQNGKNIDKELEAKRLLDGLSTFSKHVSHVSLFGKIGKKIIDFFGQDVSRFVGSALSKVPGVKNLDAVQNLKDSGNTGTENLINHFSKKKAVNDETADQKSQLYDTEQENKALQDKISGQVAENKKTKAVDNAVENMDKKIEKAEKKFGRKVGLFEKLKSK